MFSTIFVFLSKLARNTMLKLNEIDLNQKNYVNTIYGKLDVYSKNTIHPSIVIFF